MSELRKYIEKMEPLVNRAPQQMLVTVDDFTRTIDLLLDNKSAYYMDTTQTNYGGMCGLYRGISTREVVGAKLPLFCTRLSVVGIDGTQVILDESGVHIMGKH